MKRRKKITSVSFVQVSGLYQTCYDQTGKLSQRGLLNVLRLVISMILTGYTNFKDKFFVFSRDFLDIVRIIE